MVRLQAVLRAVGASASERGGMGVRVQGWHDDAYSFGDTNTKERVRFDERDGPVACGSLPANPWGFHEMHGNVWEWVEDAYAAYPKEAGGQEAVEGDAPPHRVLRGGSWFNNTYNVRSSIRSGTTPDVTNDNVGFRVARDPL